MSMAAREPAVRPPLPPDAQTPASFLFYYFVYLVIVLIPAAWILAYFLAVVPHFKEVFKDFKTTLPAFTIWTLRLADLFRAGLWVPVVMAAFAAPALLASLTVRQSYRLHRVTYVLIALIVALMFNLICGALQAAALFLPLIKLIQSVSGGSSDS
jgi:type II secretory pathway component PulF